MRTDHFPSSTHGLPPQSSSGFHVDSAECRRKVENIVGGSRRGGNGPDKKPREAETGREVADARADVLLLSVLLTPQS